MLLAGPLLPLQRPAVGRQGLRPLPAQLIHDPDLVVRDAERAMNSCGLAVRRRGLEGPQGRLPQTQQLEPLPGHAEGDPVVLRTGSGLYTLDLLDETLQQAQDPAAGLGLGVVEVLLHETPNPC